MAIRFLLFFLLLITHNSKAVRPFITDDARVVGKDLAQWETWLRFDNISGQSWHIFAFGPTNWMEISSGLVLGYDKPNYNGLEFSYALPLVQGKFLLKKYEANKLPGIGLVAGTFLPGGKGAFVPRGYGGFSFLTLTQSIGQEDRLLIHANVGVNIINENNINNVLYTWGIGTQIKTYKGFHLVGEFFSGDPYVPGTGLSYQVGFRHFISEWIQIDATMGKGLAGDFVLPFCYSAGARFVTSLFSKNSL